MSARAAVTVAETYVDQLRVNETVVRAMFPGVFDVVRDAFVSATMAGTPVSLETGPDLSREIDRIVHRDGGRSWGEVQFAAQDAAQRRLWQQHRIVYDIDPGLWAELGDTDPDDVLPADLFTRLPHPDPFITFPEPLVLPVDEITQQRIRGFFVRGSATPPGVPVGGNIHMSTHHPDATHLGLTLGGEIETYDGRPSLLPAGDQDMIWTRTTLDARVGKHTVGDMIAQALAGFQGTRATGAWRRDVPTMLRRAVSLLVYLCATNADLTPLPRQTSTGTARKTKGKGTGRGPKPSNVYGVGYRIGAALTAHRRREHTVTTESTGRQVAPHVRRAHFHTYRVGPGRQETVVKWLAPIPVNLDGPAQRSTVIAVPHR